MDHTTEDELRRIYASTSTIAVVGASADDDKAAHRIPRYLHQQGFRVLPVTPRDGELFGEPTRGSLADVDVPIDVVDVFRPAAEAVAIAEQAVAAGARVLWFQPDTDDAEAADLARDAGLTVVTGRCMGATHRELGLGG